MTAPGPHSLPGRTLLPSQRSRLCGGLQHRPATVMASMCSLCPLSTCAHVWGVSSPVLPSHPALGKPALCSHSGVRTCSELPGWARVCGHGACRPSPALRGTCRPVPTLAHLSAKSTDSKDKRRRKTCQHVADFLSRDGQRALQRAGHSPGGWFFPLVITVSCWLCCERTGNSWGISGGCLSVWTECGLCNRNFLPTGRSCEALREPEGPQGSGADQPRPTSTSSTFSASGETSPCTRWLSAPRCEG